MNTNPYIQHAGLITESTLGKIKVTLIGSGCSSCHKSLCLLGDSKAKEIEIISNTADVHAGDAVWVRINSSSGYKAVILLYLFPFFLIVSTLISMNKFGLSEGIIGIASILILIPYYSILFKFRSRISPHCKINVIKQ